MLAYLSKKISIPNDTQVTSLAWHSADGYLAVGGDNGLLRVLKLEIQQEDKDAKVKGLAAPSVLSMNQTLEAHQAAVVYVTWNNSKNKLTTCDKKGLIVVWFMFKNIWTQEMINNRNKSAVSMIQWNKDGQKICIVYEDGAVIVGSVDGNRIWGKELQGSVLTHVQWSPDSRVLLFGTNKGEVLIYDSLGAYNSKLSLHCLVNSTGPVQLVGIQWYNGSNGYISPNIPCLAVAFSNGQLQIMRHELDDKPVVVTAQMIITTICWNNNGSTLAVSGTLQRSDEREICSTRFYSPLGQLLYTLRIPGHGLSSIAWEGTGLRLALGIGSYIYFANIRYNYKWTYFSNTIVYTYTKPNSLDQCVMFWNSDTDQQNIKTCRDLLHCSSCKDFCLLVTRSAFEDIQYALLICNSLGIPVDTKYIPFEPTRVTISSTHVIVSSTNVIFVWHYRTLSDLASLEFNTVISKALETQDKLMHIDDCEIKDISSISFDISKKPTHDPITGLTASEQVMVVGRVSGSIIVFSLPQLNINTTFNLQYQPVTLSLNSDSTRLSVIDNNGIFTLYNMTKGVKLGLERKDVWDMKWSDDSPDLFAIMEKTRMYIFRGTDPEEPVISSASICSFSNLQLKAVLLDDLMKNPEVPNSQVLVDLEIKSLRDTRQLLEKVGFEDTFQFINDNPHPRLWQLLAESALNAFNFDIAEKSFVRCSDYQGIRFVKKLKKLKSDDIRRAELAAFYKNFDEAERIYIKMDRKDLAVDLRSKLGDWFRVIQLLKEGGSVGDDVQLANAWKSLGDYYAERQMWSHAIGNYQASEDVHSIAEACFMLEDYEELDKLSRTLPDNHPLLSDLANKFRCMGMCEPAVSAYLKCGNAKEALECCIELNEWTEARQISHKFRLKDVDNMIVQKANDFLADHSILSAIELYRKASYFIEAAKLLTEVAKMASAQKLLFIKLKKMYVMAGLMVENYHKYIKSTATKNTEKVKSTLQGLLIEDRVLSSDVQMLDTAWHGAEGYHMIMLAHRLLYQGETEKSMKLGLILQNYIDVLSPVLVYSLLTLSAISCQASTIASQAMMHLEMLPSLSDSERDQYEELAIEMFRLNPPRDKIYPLTCPRCETPFEEWRSTCTGCGAGVVVCMSSGDIILVDNSWLCMHCKHRTHSNVASILIACPLCHAPIVN